jgi:hypothetical protein
MSAMKRYYINPQWKEGCLWVLKGCLTLLLICALLAIVVTKCSYDYCEDAGYDVDANMVTQTDYSYFSRQDDFLAHSFQWIIARASFACKGQ